MKKKRIGLLVIVMLVIFSSLEVMAAKTNQTAIYDLQKGGRQEFQVTDETGEEAYIVIEKVENGTRIADDTYRVSYTARGAWIAGFYVVISNNQIRSAYSPFYTEISGTIEDASLTRNSNTEASYSFVYHKILRFNTGVNAYIAGNNLIVSKI